MIGILEESGALCFGEWTMGVKSFKRQTRPGDIIHSPME
jgi:hypothetical protein